MFVETILLTALFVTFCAMLLVGFHISYTLFGVSILFTLIAMISDQYFDTATGLDFFYFGIVVPNLRRQEFCLWIYYIEYLLHTL